MIKFALTYYDDTTIFWEGESLDKVVEDVKNFLKVEFKLKEAKEPLKVIIDGKLVVEINENGTTDIDILSKPKLREFVVDLTNEFGHGIVTKKARGFEDLILRRLNVGERNRWFNARDVLSGEEYDREQWREHLDNEHD